MKNSDFLDIRSFDKETMLQMLHLAQELKANPNHFNNHLAGKTLGLLFEKPSLRTRVSFEVGFKQLGGQVSVITQQEVGIGTRESVEDIARVLDRYLDVLVLRLFSHDRLKAFAEASSIPIINGLTDYSHPCQALADMMTILEFKPNAKKLCFIGDGNNVCRSFADLAILLGFEVVQICPKGYELTQAPEQLSISNNINDVDAADVVYTDVAVSMGQEAEAEHKSQIFRAFQVNESTMAKANPDAIFLHCLPAIRGEEVSAEVIDGRHSRVFDQAENRMHAQKAILLKVLLEV